MKISYFEPADTRRPRRRRRGDAFLISSAKTEIFSGVMTNRYATGASAGVSLSASPSGQSNLALHARGSICSKCVVASSVAVWPFAIGGLVDGLLST